MAGNTININFAHIFAGFGAPVLDDGMGGGDMMMGYGSTLQKIQDAGVLTCGVGGALGFSTATEATSVCVGFDCDYCTAIAAAAGVDTLFIPVSAADRFDMLSSGAIDVLIRQTTWTYERDVDLKLTFAPTTFYDGQGFLFRDDTTVTTETFTPEDFKTVSVCVEGSTTTINNLIDLLDEEGFTEQEKTDAIVETTGSADSLARFLSGECGAVTTDISGLASIGFQAANEDTPVASTIMPQVISKEPLGPVTAEGDEQWSDFVSWVVYATFAAEEYGVTQSNAVAYSDGNPAAENLLSENTLGVDVQAAIAAVGNYGEIYARNMEVLVNRAGTVNEAYPAGLIFSPPF